MTGRLAGRRALITGASRGIGRAIAEQFAQEGADLFLVATNVDRLADVKEATLAYGVMVRTYAANVAQRDQVFEMVDACVADLGGPDILVNNAGIYKAARFVDFQPEDFDQVMQVNAYGVFHAMQAALGRMVASGGGKIVNIASTAGKHESPNQAAYNASKHAVVALTRCAALEHAKDGITINAICPGFVDTDMLDAFDAHAEIAGVSVEQVKAGLISRVPMGRLLDPKEIAHLAVYLASRESDGMTGQAITISGGLRMS